ncbi:MAG: hypothetical protein KDD56_02695, partial [Bdellovibrionales bacterium]|nr:hypothetical protein [Bdellovibrionales bacterium]
RSGIKFDEIAIASGGKRENVISEWFTCPAIDEHGEKQYQELEKRLKKIERPDINRLAPSLFLSGSSGDIVYASRFPDKDAFNLAQILPDCMVYSAEINNSGSSYIVGSRSGLAKVTINSQGEFFPRETLEGAYLSNVVPEIVNLRSTARIKVIDDFISGVVQTIKFNGRLIFRNPISTDQALDDIELNLRTDDGKDTSSRPEELSTKALFELFCKIKKSQSRSKHGYLIPEITSFPSRYGENFQRFFVPRILAQEFMLIMLYPKDIQREARRPYLVEREQVEISMRSKGIRLLYSRPETSDWIVSEIWKDRVIGIDLTNNRPFLPPTNFVYAGQRVRSNQGVEIVSTSSQRIDRPNFLKLRSFERTSNGVGNIGDKFDLIERPRQTIDIVPWFEHNGKTYVLGKDYPRPLMILNQNPLDESKSAGYTVEQISAMLDVEDNKDLSSEEITAIALKILKERAGIQDSDIEEYGKDGMILTAPSIISERAYTYYLKIKPTKSLREMTGGYTGELSTTGNLRPVEVQQVFLASQVGGITSNRLEQLTYEILFEQKKHIRSWLGSELSLKVQNANHLEEKTVLEAFKVPAGHTFKELKDAANRFYELFSADFEEKNASGETIGRASLEYARPKTVSGYSANVIAFLPIIRTNTDARDDKFLVGLEQRDLSAVQIFNPETSWIVAAPSFRIASSTTKMEQAKKFVLDKLPEHFNTKGLSLIPAGIKFSPSNGTCIDEIYPFFMEVDAASAKDSRFIWVDLKELFKNRGFILDSALRTLVNRAVHALGIL